MPGTASTAPIETRERFLRDIAARIAPERVMEIYLFPPIRQGGIESGVAVIAAAPEEVDDASGSPAPAPVEPMAEERPGIAAEGPLEDSATEAGAEPMAGSRPSPSPRFTVYSATYRLQLRGPDRGAWETSVVDEADAPMLTIEAVVRGVQRRSGDLDDPEHLGGGDLRTLLAAQ